MNVCIRCQAEFGCGAASGEKRCWCEDLPTVMPVTDEGCLCPGCLRQEVEARVGLCGSCAHAKRLTTKGGGAVFQCGRAADDPRFARYPRLPMVACAGHLKP